MEDCSVGSTGPGTGAPSAQTPTPYLGSPDRRHQTMPALAYPLSPEMEKGRVFLALQVGLWHFLMRAGKDQAWRRVAWCLVRPPAPCDLGSGLQCYGRV